MIPTRYQSVYFDLGDCDGIGRRRSNARGLPFWSSWHGWNSRVSKFDNLPPQQSVLGRDSQTRRAH